jgi:hypothetical protein
MENFMTHSEFRSFVNILTAAMTLRFGIMDSYGSGIWVLGDRKVRIAREHD